MSEDVGVQEMPMATTDKNVDPDNTERDELFNAQRAHSRRRVTVDPPRSEVKNTKKDLFEDFEKLKVAQQRYLDGLARETEGGGETYLSNTKGGAFEATRYDADDVGTYIPRRVVIPDAADNLVGSILLYDEPPEPENPYKTSRGVVDIGAKPELGRIVRDTKEPNKIRVVPVKDEELGSMVESIVRFGNIPLARLVKNEDGRLTVEKLDLTGPNAVRRLDLEDVVEKLGGLETISPNHTKELMVDRLDPVGRKENKAEVDGKRAEPIEVTYRNLEVTGMDGNRRRVTILPETKQQLLDRRGTAYVVVPDTRRVYNKKTGRNEQHDATFLLQLRVIRGSENAGPIFETRAIYPYKLGKDRKKNSGYETALADISNSKTSEVYQLINLGNDSLVVSERPIAENQRKKLNQAIKQTNNNGNLPPEAIAKLLSS